MYFKTLPTLPTLMNECGDAKLVFSAFPPQNLYCAEDPDSDSDMLRRSISDRDVKEREEANWRRNIIA